MKNFTKLLLGSLVLFSLSGCTAGDMITSYTSISDQSETTLQNTSETPKQRVYMDEIKGTLKDFTGATLTMESQEQTYVFDLSEATLECEDGMITGDEISVIYEGQLSNKDTSTVKALKVDGAEPTEENIKSGEYKVARPFNIATKGDVSEVAQDFINFILSTEGQAVVSESGYIALDKVQAYAGSKSAGKVSIAGSSSITPVMEKLKEAYLKVNPSAEIEIQESDSTTGMTSVADGICDIGMASREVKEEELAKGLKATVIATDGIAVIVNKANTLDDITSDQVKSIYVGDALSWDEIIK